MSACLASSSPLAAACRLMLLLAAAAAPSPGGGGLGVALAALRVRRSVGGVGLDMLNQVDQLTDDVAQRWCAVMWQTSVSAAQLGAVCSAGTGGYCGANTIGNGQ